MAALHVIEELQSFLVEEGVAQLPSAAPSTGLPSVWLQPKDGAPIPRRQGGTWLEDCTITLIDSQLAGAPGLEAWLEEAFVDVIVRHRSAPAGKLVHRVIRGLIHPDGHHGGRKLWTMNDLLVEYSTIWRPEQPLPFADDGDSKVYSRVAAYRFGCRRKALAGLPYAP